EPDGGLRLRFDLRLALGPPAPAAHHEPTGILDERAQLLVARGMKRVLLAERLGLFEQRELDIAEELVDLVGNVAERPRLLLSRVAPRHHGLPAFDVARAELDSNRHALQLPIIELEPWADVVAVVEVGADGELVD